MTGRRTLQRTQRYVDRARLFVRDFTEGVTLDDLRRLFDRDATQAYSVLTRDSEGESEPTDRVAQTLYRLKVIFLGLSYKLTPPRRVLFAASLVCALLGLVQPSTLDFGSGGTRFSIDFSPFWFLASIGGLLFLFTMEMVDRIRVRDELEVARQLQGELLPGDTPELPGWSFAHAYRTANEVGGDYYDFLPLADGRLALIVGDASGHGIAAGLLMAVANATLKTALELDPDPPAVAAMLNRTLFRTGDRRAFMTLFYGLLDPATGRLEHLSAGHPFPLLRRADGAVEELGRGALPLGMRESLELEADVATVAPGDVLVLYTDGLPEAVGDAERAFGFERLRRLVARPGTPKVLHQRIVAAFDEHVGEEAALEDDWTLAIVARAAAPVEEAEPTPLTRSRPPARPSAPPAVPSPPSIPPPPTPAPPRE